MAKFKARSITKRGVTLEGDIRGQLKKIDDRMVALFKGLTDEAKLVTEEEANRVLDVSQELVPVRTGALHSTGKVNLGSNQFGPFATVSYGGKSEIPTQHGKFNVDYAVLQHEDLEFEHPTGQAKFLEQAVNEVLGTSETKARLKARFMEVFR